MPTIKEKYVVDENGNQVAVFIDIQSYRNLMKELEELESIRAYDSAKTSGDPIIPFDQAVTEIEQKTP